MGDEQPGKPIPKIVGRGKNGLKRPFPAHGYDLRPTSTRCHSISNLPCSFCHHYKTCQEETSEYNLQLRKQLFKTTTRALVLDRLKRQKDKKVSKLRQLLQDRSAEVRERDMRVQDYIRDARLRKDELQITVSQLDRAKEEIAELNTQLDHERKRMRTMEEVNALEKQEYQNVKDKFSQTITHITHLLDELQSPEQLSAGIPHDDQSLGTRIGAIRETVREFSEEISTEVRSDEGEVRSSQALIYKIITDVLCGVCHEMFIDPVALPCGHTFCEFCIRMWFKRTRGCPVCRHKVISCGQLHAVYQFRMICELLENFRTPEEQTSRSEEKERRDGLRDELYRDPTPPRRFRERPVSTSDRGERFAHRRRRVDGNNNPPIPYHIPLPDSVPRLDMLPPPQPFQISPLVFSTSETTDPAPTISTSTSDSLREPSRNVMTLLLNETFSSIDRFIRGSPNIFPVTRPPINMIENTPDDIGSAVAPSTTEQNSSDGGIMAATHLLDVTSLEVGSPLNPIVISNHSSEEDLMVEPEEPPPPPPPALVIAVDGEDIQYQSILSESSDELWPNNAWQPVEETASPNILTTELVTATDVLTPDTVPSVVTAADMVTTTTTTQDVIDLRGFQGRHMSTSDNRIVVSSQESDLVVEPLLDGNFLSTTESEYSSSSEEEEEDSETETESSGDSEEDRRRETQDRRQGEEDGDRRRGDGRRLHHIDSLEDVD